MPDMLFRGTAPAMVTPFTEDDRLDEAAFRRLIDFQIEGGVEALVVLGTTGENPTVTEDERRQLTRLAVEHTAGRVPVIAGTGTNNTAQSVLFSREARDIGVDALLVVGPYYNKPTPSGLIRHVSMIAEAADLPIVFYNVPGRTGSNVTADTQLRLAEEVPLVVGTKEASGDLAQISEIIAGRRDSFAVWAGDDELALPVIALGGDGVISVVANAIPGPFTAMIRQCLSGDFASARRGHFEMLGAMRSCFYESNPGPIKAVLAQLGMMRDDMRPPMGPLADETRRRVLDAFEGVASRNVT
jgi:4-hydroxy-tetrahydrodipicolinate synthase